MRLPPALAPLFLWGPLLGLENDLRDGSPASRPDPELARRLGDLVKDFQGDVGVYVRHLASGREVAIRADEPFPTASLIKVPILIGVFDALERGDVEWRKGLEYRESRKYPGEDLLASFRDGERVPLSRLVALMVSFSDNTASLWCQELAGGGAAINRWLEAGGFATTRVNSRTEGREKAKEEFGWGQTTPREMAELLVRIREGKAVSRTASAQMYRILCRSIWDGESLSQIPPTAQAASKQGAVNASRSEVVLVNAPSGDYVFCAITKNQKDSSWSGDNEGFVLLRRVSRLLWETFEPGSTWSPPPDAGRYRP
ncbi:MAG TPA: serine hydrolase [Planctomycetota bacterium]|jgi:beta-lactamase class A|nr:serine hydrolase [Planctomycetota bacterium]